MILLVIGGIFALLGVVCGIASFVFFVMVVMKMFQNDQANLGIICIVLTLVTGLVGLIVTFVLGWTKATEWDLKKVMTSWTIALVLLFVFFGIAIGAIIVSATMLAPEPQFDVEVPSSLNIEFDNDLDSFDLPEDLPEAESTPIEQP